MNLKVKKLSEDAKISPPAYEGDAGYDVYSTQDIHLLPLQRMNIPLDISLEFDSDHICLVQGKSGVTKKYGIDTIGNVIDSSYRGCIHAQLVNVSNEFVFLRKGMKIAQLVFVRVSTPETEYVEDLCDSTRGDKGFGSSGL